MKRVLSIICLALLFISIFAIISEDLGDDEELKAQMMKNMEEDKRFFENDVEPGTPQPDFDKDFDADFPPDDEIDIDELSRSEVVEYEEGDQSSPDDAEIAKQVEEDDRHPEKYEIGDEDPIDAYRVSTTLFSRHFLGLYISHFHLGQII